MRRTNETSKKTAIATGPHATHVTFSTARPQQYSGGHTGRQHWTKRAFEDEQGPTGRLCASAGDLTETKWSSLPRFRFKSVKFFDSGYSTTPRSTGPSGSVTPNSGHRWHPKYPTGPVESGRSGGEMAPPENSSSSSTRRTDNEKNSKVKNGKSGGGHELRGAVPSFVSRFFTSSTDKQRERRQQRAKVTGGAGEYLGNISSEGREGTVPTAVAGENVDDDETGSGTVTSGRAVYNTASLGRYPKQELSPVRVYQQEDNEDKSDGLISAVSVIELPNASLENTAPLSTSLKILTRQRSPPKKRTTVGSGSESDLTSTTISHYGNYSGIDSPNSRSRLDPSDSTTLDNDNHKKARSLIISTLGFSVSSRTGQQKSPKQSSSDRSTSLTRCNSGGSSLKSTGLAGKITRGIQEFANSSERLMSWKAKLKKTKVDNGPYGQAGADNSGEGDADETRPAGQSNAESAAKTDPLPRAPKYFYKTNSIDSNYDMAVGTYDAGGHEQVWMMEDGRKGKRPEGFYVGLTMVNHGTVETVIHSDAHDQNGLYFRDKEGDGGGADAVQDPGKHYEEIDLLRKTNDECTLKNMASHRDDGIYNIQQLVGHKTGKDDSMHAHNSFASEDLNLPPPTRITPYSGVPQGKDGDIVKPIAFRPVVPTSMPKAMRAQSIPKHLPGNGEMVLVSPIKQAQLVYPYRRSPPPDLSHSNYENTNVESSQNNTTTKTAPNLSAFTPPSARRTMQHLTVAGSVDEDDRVSNCSANRETPGRSIPAQAIWHRQSSAQPQHPISYEDYCRRTHSQSQQKLDQSRLVNKSNGHQVQNEYDTIADFRPHPPPNRQNFPVTPTNANRSFDFNVGLQKKPSGPQQPAPPVRTAASLAPTGHHQHSEGGPNTGVPTSQNYGSLGSRNSSGIHVTPSPSDSGVAELELALREKENELVHLRQTMEHNEQAIVRVYQEKEKRWQEKLREWAIRLEHAVSAEQRFLTEVDQLQNERMELHSRVQNLLAEKQGLQRKCKELESELFACKARLDDRRQTNWVVCKQCGCVLTFETRAGAASVTSPDDEMVSSRESQHLPDPPYPPSQSPASTRYPPVPSGKDEEGRMAAPDPALRSEVDALKMEVANLRQSLHDQVAVFSAEKRRWEAEKQRVLQYQKMLEDTNPSNGHRTSTQSTPTGSVKNMAKEPAHPYAYANVQHAGSPYHGVVGANLNVARSEPELEV